MSSKILVITDLFFSSYLIVINTPEQRKGWSPNGRVIVCGEDKCVIEMKCPYALVQQATIIDSNFLLCKSELDGELFVKNIISTISKCSYKYLLLVQRFLVIYTLKIFSKFWFSSPVHLWNITSRNPGYSGNHLTRVFFMLL
jgi:hypothetical protein